MNFKKLLCTLSGDDYEIIRQCDRSLETRFARIGAFVLVIFVVCFTSSYFSFIKLFPNYWVGLPIALFFALMIINIYLLLLYTLSKDVLPHQKAVKSKVFSTALRVAFICFIAVVISKPLEAFVFSAPLEKEIAGYKDRKISEYTQATEEFFAGETERLKFNIESEKKLDGSSVSERIDKYQKLLAEKEKQKADLLADMRNLVEHSNYYIESIAILNQKYPICWLLTLALISIFLTPAVLKIFISEKSDFYTLKKQIEIKLVHVEYLAFKERYRRIFREKHGAARDYTELYHNPPFNTIPKIDSTQYHPESDLLAELYDA